AEDLRDAPAGDLRHHHVELAQRGDLGPVGPRRLAVEERQVVEADRLGGEEPPPFGPQLRRRAQVDHRAEAELVAQAHHVARGQPMERVAAEDTPPAHRSAAGRRVPAHVAEVEAALEVDDASHAEHAYPRTKGRSRPEARALRRSAGPRHEAEVAALVLVLEGEPPRVEASEELAPRDRLEKLL